MTDLKALPWCAKCGSEEFDLIHKHIHPKTEKCSYKRCSFQHVFEPCFSAKDVEVELAKKEEMILFWEGKHAGLSNDYHRALDLFKACSESKAYALAQRDEQLINVQTGLQELKKLNERDKRLADELEIYCERLGLKNNEVEFDDIDNIVWKVIRELRGGREMKKGNKVVETLLAPASVLLGIFEADILFGELRLAEAQADFEVYLNQARKKRGLIK